MNNLSFPTRTILILLIAIAFSACKTTKKAARSPLNSKNPQELTQLLNDHDFKFDWLNAKIEATYTKEDKTNSFNITLRIRKDSVMWLSISPALGIEVARVLITKDTLKLVDRLNSKYAISNFSHINELLQVTLDFETLQELLVGNSFSYLDDKKFRSSFIDGDLYVLSTLGKRKLKKSIVDDKEIKRNFNQDIWMEPDIFKVVKMLIQDRKANKKLLADYKDFRDVEGQKFAFKSSFNIQTEKTVNITLEYTKVNINKPQEFPFSIPEKYEKM